MSTEKSTATHEQPSTAIVKRLDPQALIETALEKQSPIEVLERLVALAVQVREMQAREAWLGAMAKFQEECPAILKNKAAGFTAKGGKVAYTWATLDQLLGEMQPIAGRLGLSFSFQQRQEKDQALANCRISHEMGHSEESGFVTMPITFNDGTAASPQQQVGKAFTYAKRYALLAVSGIAPEDNPELATETITTSASEAAPAAGNSWVGRILNTKQKTGTGAKGPWTKYVFQTADAQEFESFDRKHVDFVKEAAGSPVEITWAQGKYGKDIVSIGPAPEA